MEVVRAQKCNRWVNPQTLALNDSPEFEKLKVASTEIKSKGNKVWFELSGGLRNQGFEKLGFHGILISMHILIGY